MRRKVRAIVGVGFALLMVVVGAAWVGSYWKGAMGAAGFRLSRTYGLVLDHGSCSGVWVYSLERDEVEYPAQWSGAVWGENWTLPERNWPMPLWQGRTVETAAMLESCSTSQVAWAGAGVFVGEMEAGGGAIASYQYPALVVQVPFWMLMVVAGYGAVRGLWPWRRRVKKGCCPGCGYDLRASTERCPECGRAVERERKEKLGFRGRLLRRQCKMTRFMRRNVWWVVLTLVLTGVIVMQQRELWRPGAKGRVVMPPQVVQTVFLGKPVTAGCKEVALHEVLAGWAKEAGCAMRVDWKALEGAGVDQNSPVTIAADGKASLEEALVMLCAEMEHVDYDFPTPDVVVVSTKENVERSSEVMVVYEVGDLLVPANVQDGELFERADRLVELVQKGVEPDTWRDQGGTVGSISRLGDRLVIRNSRRTQRKVAEFLAKLRQARGD